MDAACPCPLAVIGRAVLPPGLRERLDGPDAEEAQAEVEELAALLGSGR